MINLFFSVLVFGSCLAEGRGLKSEQGAEVRADAAYCDSVGFDISVYNRY